jgi:hypothetical protein
MEIREENIFISFEGGPETEKICRKFCRILFKLNSLKNEHIKRVNIDLLEMMMGVLDREFSVKVQKNIQRG